MKVGWLWLLGLLGGCVSDAPLNNAPCPCLAGQTCCELTGLCVADGVECPVLPDFATIDMQPVDARVKDAAPLDAQMDVPVDAMPPADAAPLPDARLLTHAVTIEPAVGSHLGGTLIRVTVDPPLTPERVSVGGRPCLELAQAGDGWHCTTPASDGIASRVDVVVASAETAVVAPRAFHYLLPAFSDLSIQAGLPLPDPLTPQYEGQSIVPIPSDRGLEVLLPSARGADHLRQLDALRFTRSPPAWVREIPATFRAGAFDADADGRLDVFMTRRTGGQLSAWLTVHRGTPDGFDAPQEIPRIGDLNSAPALVPLDVDSDGDLDLIGALSGEPRRLFAWFRNDGDDFVLMPIEAYDQARALTASEITDVEVVDFDQDGWVDVFACGDQLWFLRGGPDGFVEDSVAVGLPALNIPCGDLEIADLDADGWFDLLLVPETGRQGPRPRATGVTAFFSARGERLETRGPYQNDEHNPRCPGTHYGNHMVRMGAGSLVVLDGDLDGDLDLLLPQSAATCPGAMSFYRADLRPDKLVYAGEAVAPGHHTSASGAWVHDFDGDGDLDVLSNGFVYSEGVRLLRNNAMENALPDTPVQWLDITVLRAGRLVPGAWFEIDLDGPADAPDWAPGPGRLRLINLTDSALDGHRGETRIVGLGDAAPPYHVRVHFPGGGMHTARIEAPNQRVIIDPAAD